MQYQKEEVRKAILKAARSEFIKHGFQKASIRQIAEKADVLSSNIYNYFDGKDDIFGEIIRPAIREIEKFKKFMIEWEFSRPRDEHGNLKQHQEVMLQTVKTVDRFRDLFNLLFFKAHGSSLEDSMDNLVNWFTKNMYNTFSYGTNNMLNKFYIHYINSIIFGFIKEILRHDIKGEKMEQAAVDMMTFIYSGHEGLVEWKKSQKQK
ncbi:MAG: TetR/AcrR family transcriptional regulator [Halothermotrichaceae bacterium]